MLQSIFAVLGSGFGIISGIKKIAKIKKVFGYIRKFIKEGKEAVVQGKDLKPAVDEVIRLGKQVKFGDTSQENVAKMELLARASIKLACETNEFIKEMKDVSDLLKKLKEDFK